MKKGRVKETTQPAQNRRDQELQEQMQAEQAQGRQRMTRIKHKIRGLSRKGRVGVLIASGMGQQAQQLLVQNSILVVTGASGQSPEEIVSAYLQGTLKVGDSLYDH